MAFAFISMVKNDLRYTTVKQMSHPLVANNQPKSFSEKISVTIAVIRFSLHTTIAQYVAMETNNDFVDVGIQHKLFTVTIPAMYY